MGGVSGSLGAFYGDTEKKDRGPRVRAGDDGTAANVWAPSARFWYEIGELQGLTERTAKRDWAFARAWLQQRIVEPLRYG